MFSIFRNLGIDGAAAVVAEIREVADLGSVPDSGQFFYFFFTPTASRASPRPGTRQTRSDLRPQSERTLYWVPVNCEYVELKCTGLLPVSPTTQCQLI